MESLLTYKDDNVTSFYSALTIDVEDGINIAMRDSFHIEMKPTGRVVDNVDVILEICDRHKVKATFFVLGEIAEFFPDLIKKIDANGHEIGIHGYHHDQVFRLTPQKLKSELTRARNLIEHIIGKKVLGFRAPAFSINANTSWALPVVAECGFAYDSSIYPSLSPRYGWKGFSEQIYNIQLGAGTSLIEVPLSVYNIMGKNLPVCGGGYLRYFPYGFTRKAFSSISRKRPVIVYMHPYELDTERYPDYFYNARSKAALRQKLPLMFYRFKKDTVKSKLEHLTGEFRFLPLRDIISNLDKAGLIPSVEIKGIQ